MHPPHPQGNSLRTTAARAFFLPHRSAVGPCFRSLGSNNGLDLRRVQCNPLQHRDKQGRRLDSHQHDSAYKADAFLDRATSAFVSSHHEHEDSNLIQQFWRLPALPGASLVSAAESQRKDSAALSFIQFHSPVSLTEELGPTFNTNIVSSIERSPSRTNRHLPQRHVRFGWRTVGLSLVALQASQNTVLPCAGTTTRTRLHVVERQFFAARLSTTVLTGESVPLVDVPATECDRVLGNPVILRQRDHLRHPNSKRHRLDEQFILVRNPPNRPRCTAESRSDRRSVPARQPPE